MTNPDNAVGTNAAYGGRTSVNAFNDNLSAYSRGVMSGWGCTPAGGLVVSLGGNGTERDVAVAEDNIGNKTSINNISGSPITLTMSAAPGAGTRIDSIVAYVDASPQGEATVTDNYGACGLIVVQGTPSSTPTAPSDNDIRSAITSDGASGPTAYYAVLANISMASGTTDITENEIAAGAAAALASQNLDFATYSTTREIKAGVWIDGRTIYKKTMVNNLSGASNLVPTGVPNLDLMIDWRNTVVSSPERQSIIGFRTAGPGGSAYSDEYIMQAAQYNKDTNMMRFEFGNQFVGNKTVYTTIWYVKAN